MEEGREREREYVCIERDTNTLDPALPPTHKRIYKLSRKLQRDLYTKNGTAKAKRYGHYGVTTKRYTKSSELVIDEPLANREQRQSDHEPDFRESTGSIEPVQSWSLRLNGRFERARLGTI